MILYGSSGTARGFRQARCNGCGLTESLCVCALWPPLETPIDISVIMPASESRSASNSARLLGLWLEGTALHVRGGEHSLRDRAPISPAELVERPHSALLFPGGTEPAPLPTPVKHLIVPDGTWSQARRIERHWFAPHAMPRVELDSGWPSLYGLRRGQRGLCTFEAVAVAIGLLADPQLAATLLERFAEWARRARRLKAGGPPPEALHPTPPVTSASLEPHPAARRLAASVGASRSPRRATNPGCEVLVGETGAPFRVSTNEKEVPSPEVPLLPGSTPPSLASLAGAVAQPGTDLGHEVLGETGTPFRLSTNKQAVPSAELPVLPGSTRPSLAGAVAQPGTDLGHEVLGLSRGNPSGPLDSTPHVQGQPPAESEE